MKHAILAICLAGAWEAQAAARHVLENDKVRIAFDGGGAVTELVDKRSAPSQNLIAHPLPGFWKLIFHRGRNLENVVEPQFQQYRFERAGDRLTIAADRLRMGGETLDIRLAFDVRLEGDEIRWTARVENRAPVTIVDFYFPQVGGVAGLGDARLTDDLIWPSQAGTRIRNVKATMRPRWNPQCRK